MRTATARQLTNAVAAHGPANWLVKATYTAGTPLQVAQSGLTYRQACAIARSVREACGYASVERAPRT